MATSTSGSANRCEKKKSGMQITRQQFPIRLSWTTTEGTGADSVADCGVPAKLDHRWPVLVCGSEQSSISSRSVAAKLWQEKILKSRFKVKAELELIWKVIQLYAFTRNPMPLLIAVQNIRSLPDHHADILCLQFLEQCSAVYLTAVWLTSGIYAARIFNRCKKIINMEAFEDSVPMLTNQYNVGHVNRLWMTQ